MYMRFVSVCIGLAICLPSVSGDCEGPPFVEGSTSNSTGISPFPDGTVIRYDCTVGYSTSGTSRFYTCSGTEWTGGNIICDPILCPYISPPENGKITNSPTRRVGTQIIFACNVGHDMSGSSTLTCRVDGDWFPSTAPTCTQKDCGEFGSVQNANTFQDTSQCESNHYGCVVEVTCNRGYVINGSPRVECQASGTWGPKPTCLRTTCPPYPNTNSSCILNVKPFGKYLFFMCKEGVNVSVTKTGDGRAECLSSGQWDREDDACFCDCYVGSNFTTVVFTNLNSKLFLLHGLSLRWTCMFETTEKSIDFRCHDGLLLDTKKRQTYSTFNEEDLCENVETTQKPATTRVSHDTTITETSTETIDSSGNTSFTTTTTGVSQDKTMIETCTETIESSGNTDFTTTATTGVSQDTTVTHTRTETTESSGNAGFTTAELSGINQETLFRETVRDSACHNDFTVLFVFQFFWSVIAVVLSF